jgi:hypothetical protein
VVWLSVRKEAIPYITCPNHETPSDKKNTYPTRKFFDKLGASNHVEVRDMSTLGLGVHGAALHVGRQCVSSGSGCVSNVRLNL